MSRLGNKIAGENLKQDAIYNVKRHTGEATVQVVNLTAAGVEVLVKFGAFKNPQGGVIGRGKVLTLPYDSQWYEPTV